MAYLNSSLWLFIFYSFKKIRFNYDLKLLLLKREITFLNAKIMINVICDYEYSIRPCTFKNVLYLINYNVSDGKRDTEYKALMDAIKKYSISLVDIVDSNHYFQLTGDGYYSKFFRILKTFLDSKRLGMNIIRFLLHEMRNNIIRDQMHKLYMNRSLYNNKFDNLRIRLASKAFELMPFAFSPKGTKPSIATLLELFDCTDRNDEILYRNIVDYINENNILFLKPEDIGYSKEDFIKLAASFNNKIDCLYTYYNDHKIAEFKGNYTIKFYYKATMDVIELAIKSAKNENNSFKIKEFNTNSVEISAAKVNILNRIFLNSHIGLVNGSAGTGKTTLIKELIKLYTDKRILCLTTTNTANNNLKIDNMSHVVYMNISKFENEKYHKDYDFIIVDEAGFVSTESIRQILKFYQNSFFLLVGDPGQIESIDFGNWFSILIEIMKPYNVVYTLNDEHRTNISELVKVWDSIRDGKRDNILELLSVFNMSEKISDDIFHINENEIVLCLNYDGLYGINNINRYLQASNINEPHEYQQNIYKINDPVVFIVNDYDEYGIYNNLKGSIANIIEDDDNITFEILLFNKVSIGRLSNEIQIECRNNSYYAIVTKRKYYDQYDTDMNIRTKLPFQISYAMSIHKCQGLEFDSVKIVITKETDELITKNIFYTAVTRAKKYLKIYWEPEVANFVLKNIENNDKSKNNDLAIIKQCINI